MTSVTSKKTDMRTLVYMADGHPKPQPVYIFPQRTVFEKPGEKFRNVPPLPFGVCLFGLNILGGDYSQVISPRLGARAIVLSIVNPDRYGYVVGVSEIFDTDPSGTLSVNQYPKSALLAIKWDDDDHNAEISNYTDSLVVERIDGVIAVPFYGTTSGVFFHRQCGREELTAQQINDWTWNVRKLEKEGLI